MDDGNGSDDDMDIDMDGFIGNGRNGDGGRSSSELNSINTS